MKRLSNPVRQKQMPTMRAPKVMSDNASSNGYVVKLDEENVQKLVSLFYIKIGAPPPNDWHGRGGTISKAMNAFDMSVSADERRKVERIITKTYHSLLRGEEYNKGRKSRKNLTTIADGDNIQQLVADYREAGLSFSQTTVMINMYCRKNELLTVRRSAVVSCKKRMKRMVGPVSMVQAWVGQKRLKCYILRLFSNRS